MLTSRSQHAGNQNDYANNSRESREHALSLKRWPPREADRPSLASMTISFPYPVAVTYEVLRTWTGGSSDFSRPSLPQKRLQKELSSLPQESLAGEHFLGISTGSFNLAVRTAISQKGHPHLNPYHTHVLCWVLVWAAGSERLWRHDIIWAYHDP